ncbi:14477_t:CDS:2 [Ambispora leptoticha]|uniref:14477_t:CDS:1 n=1 Tax=Ambispora leptoticha TaxID=144679 RepID=A0A9N8VMG9_9GLOM|nr:14477_t:CDS:2 [Ambispora leptoticha]
MSKPASVTSTQHQPTHSGESEQLKVEHEHAEKMIITIEDEFDEYNEEEDEDYQEGQEELVEEDESEESDVDSEDTRIDPEEVQELIRTAVAPLPNLFKEQLLDPTVTILRDGKKIASPMKNTQDIDQITEQFKAMLTNNR